MKSLKDIQKLVKEFDIKPRSEMRSKVLDDALRLQKSRNRQRTSDMHIWRMIMHSKITKPIAAAIAVCTFILIFFIGNGQTLYAQAIKAIGKADSVHVIVKEYRDGNWFKDHEIWYDSDHGVREEERYENHVDIRIDDKQFEWRYTEGKSFAAKINSYRAPDEWAKNLYNWLRYNPERDSSGDLVINGLHCEMYTLSMPNGRKLASVWVDSDNYVHKFEVEMQEDEQSVKGVANVEYNVNIDKRLFAPEFNSDVEIVSPRGLIEKQFPIESAIYKHENLGFVFAVHELRFCNGFKYLVCSNRLTEETRKEVGAEHPWAYYGEADIRGRYDKAGMYLDTSDEPLLLARMRHDGIQVDWYALVPAGSKAKHNNGCDLNVNVSAANELRKRLETQELPIRDNFRLNLSLEGDGEQSAPLSEICQKIFAFGEKFSSIVHTFQLTNIVTETDGNKVLAWKTPGTELSEEDYIKGVKSRVEYYLNQSR